MRGTRWSHDTASPPKHIQDRATPAFHSSTWPSPFCSLVPFHVPPCPTARFPKTNGKRGLASAGTDSLPQKPQNPGISRVPKFSTLGSWDPASVPTISPPGDYRPSFPASFSEDNFTICSIWANAAFFPPLHFRIITVHPINQSVLLVQLL